MSQNCAIVRRERRRQRCGPLSAQKVFLHLIEGPLQTGGPAEEGGGAQYKHIDARLAQGLEIVIGAGTVHFKFKGQAQLFPQLG